MSEFEKHTIVISQIFLEHFAEHLTENGWPTVKNHSVNGGSGHFLLEHIFCDKADTFFPISALRWSMIYSEIHAEVVLIALLQLLQLVFQQDVIDGSISKDQRVACAILVL